MLDWLPRLAAAALTASSPAQPADVAFCFVRDAPHHDFLTPPAPAGTDLRPKMREWLAATLPALSPTQLDDDVQCDPDVPRSLYDSWIGWSKLSDGDVFSEAFRWPSDWYLRHPSSPKRRGRNRR